MRGSPGLGTWKLHDRTLLNHGSRYIKTQLCSVNKAVSCAPGKVGKSGIALKDEQRRYSTFI